MTSEILDGEERKPINFTLPRHLLTRRLVGHFWMEINTCAMTAFGSSSHW